MDGFTAASDAALFPDSAEKAAIFSEAGDEVNAPELDLFGIPKTEKPEGETSAEPPPFLKPAPEAGEAKLDCAGQGSGAAKPTETATESSQSEAAAPAPDAAAPVRSSPPGNKRAPTGLVRERFEKRVKEFKAVLDGEKIDLEQLRCLSQTGAPRSPLLAHRSLCSPRG